MIAAKIKILTPAVKHEMPVDISSKLEVYKASQKLKQWVCIDEGTPFMVYLEIPSKMNAQDFELDETIEFAQLKY